MNGDGFFVHLSGDIYAAIDQPETSGSAVIRSEPRPLNLEKANLLALPALA
jgi:hypothetical protein